MLPAGHLRGHQADIAGHLPATLKAAHIAQRQHRGQGQDRPYPRMAHQQLRILARGRCFFRLPVHLLHLPVQILQHLQQIVAPPLGPGSQFQLLQPLLSFPAPQLALLLQTLV